MAEPRANNFIGTENLKKENFNMSEKEKQKIFTDDPTTTAKQLFQYMYQKLQEKFVSEDEPTEVRFAGILHNHDTARVWDNIEGRYVDQAKQDHIHFAIQLLHCTKKYLHTIAECVGVEPQYIEPPKGKYSVENSLAYLIHAKDGTKYQYDPADVITFDSFDYQQYYNEHRQHWSYIKSTQTKKNGNIKKDWLLEQVQKGRVSKQQILLDKTYSPVYANNMTQFTQAFEFCSEQQSTQFLVDFEARRLALTTIFVTGKPRVGKTFLAKKLIRALIAKMGEHYDKRWQVYQTAATNPFDDYLSEQILFLDDVRASSMKAMDWLKLMDPENSSRLSARYHNKRPASPVIIITSYKSPEEFFGFMGNQNSGDESLDQFLGRLSFVMKVSNANDSSDTKKVHLGEIYHYNTPQSINITPDATHFNTRTVSFQPRYQNEALSPEDAITRLVDKVLERNDPSKSHPAEPKPLIDVQGLKPGVDPSDRPAMKAYLESAMQLAESGSTAEELEESEKDETNFKTVDELMIELGADPIEPGIPFWSTTNKDSKKEDDS